MMIRLRPSTGRLYRLRHPAGELRHRAAAAAGFRGPANEGMYKVGKPYQVAGVWYYPSENPNYDETGIASWYGPNFHEKYTANGEVFDQNGLTAAHRPCRCRVSSRSRIWRTAAPWKFGSTTAVLSSATGSSTCPGAAPNC